MKREWRRYNLGGVLGALFLGSWIGQTWTGWREFVGEQASRGQEAWWLGADGYVWVLGQATFENWQSEFLQLFAMVVLTAYLVYRGSPESKDSQEEVQRAIEQRRQSFSRMTAD